MTTMTELTVAELSELYQKVAYDDDARRIVENELASRDRAEKSRRAAREQTSEWVDCAHAQMMAAERELNGNLVRRDSPVKDAWSLWSGSEAYALAHCSEELRLWWQEPGQARITVSQYKQQIADGKRIQRDERDQEDPGREENVNPLGAAGHMAGHVARDAGRAAGRAAEIGTREAIYAQRRQQVTARAQEMAGQLHAAVAVRAPAALVKTQEPIDGDEVLRYIYTFLKRFAVWGSDAEPLVCALWIAHTHARDASDMPIWEYCARLGIFGPSGSGKSRKSRLVGKLAYKGKILVEPTKPSFVDFVADHNTVIITEADEQFRSPGRSRSLVAIINASYEPDRSTSRKQGGVKVEIPLFTHAVLDGIDTLLSSARSDLDAMISRCFVLLSRVAPEGYRPPRFDAQARMVAEQISQRATAWMAQEVEDGMAADVPDVPAWLGNRPFGKWEPLFVIAGRADAAIRRRLQAEGKEADSDEPGPWSTAVADACDLLETGNGQAEQPEEVKDELDRIMASWDEEE